MSELRSDIIKGWAQRLGFDLVGIAPAEPIAYPERLREYLRRGYHGRMAYLGRPVEKRIDPRLLLPGARSIICTGTNYYAPEPACGGVGPFGRVARYAWGRDYHEVIRSRLEELAGRIRHAVSRPVRLGCFVDSAALAEKNHAARAGLGWVGKNSLLVNERFGSWLVLGEIVTDLELACDEPVEDQCGTCVRCLEACPTGALVEPRVLDARRCVSYLTIESREEVPGEFRNKLGDWLFGCDACQEVCPFNEDTPTTRAGEFAARREWCRVGLRELMELDAEQFQRRFAGSSIARADREHLVGLARRLWASQSS